MAMNEVPRSRKELEDLVANQVQESARLEYKGSPALSFPKHTSEFAKDISAMANSDGGVIVYGIVEKDHLPEAVDEGVPNVSMTRERLEQLILSNIRPRPVFEVVQIALTDAASAYVIAVQRSDRPHQNAVDKKYYKRFNFSAHPMEDYEIEDVRSRGLISVPEVQIAFEAIGHIFYFVVANVGKWPVFDVTFIFPAEFQSWLEKKKALAYGFRTLPPGRSLRFSLGSYIGLIGDKSPYPKNFEVTLSYRLNPDSAFKTETLAVDLMDFFGSKVEESEIKQFGDQVAKGLDALTKQIEKLNGKIDYHIGPMSTGTGLNLSVTALRNLRHLQSGSADFEKVLANEINVVEEVLGVDQDLASRIWEYLSFPSGKAKLEDVEGVSPELATKIRQQFIVHDGD